MVYHLSYDVYQLCYECLSIKLWMFINQVMNVYHLWYECLSFMLWMFINQVMNVYHLCLSLKLWRRLSVYLPIRVSYLRRFRSVPVGQRNDPSKVWG